MCRTRFSVVSSVALLSVGIALGCWQPLAVSQAAADQAAAGRGPAVLREIHVDRHCQILPDASDALAEYSQEDLRHDHAICHLESVSTSRHIEEALRDGVRERSRVTVMEQEYLLQNVTSERVTFVVEHSLANDWTIDSEPQPVKVEDNIAYFRVNAEPGQVVRLHVGARRTRAIAN